MLGEAGSIPWSEPNTVCGEMAKLFLILRRRLNDLNKPSGQRPFLSKADRLLG
jgi:hypothetical protein